MAPQRDYDRVELVWPGKRTEVERVRLPFQTIERVNDARRSRGGQRPFDLSEPDTNIRSGGGLKAGPTAGATA